MLWKTEMSRNRKSIFTIKASNPVIEIRIPHNSKIRLWSVVWRVNQQYPPQHFPAQLLFSIQGAIFSVMLVYETRLWNNLEHWRTDRSWKLLIFNLDPLPDNFFSATPEILVWAKYVVLQFHNKLNVCLIKSSDKTATTV